MIDLQASIVTVDGTGEVSGAAVLFGAGMDLGHIFLMGHVLANDLSNQAQAEKTHERCHFDAQAMRESKKKQCNRCLCK